MSTETKSPKCARTACDSPGLLPHRDTGKLYCPKCARRINEECSEKFFTFPGETKSPGMRALEAINKRGWYIVDDIGSWECVPIKYAVEIIERETGVTELEAENKRLRSTANDTENYHSIACQELENSNKKIAELRKQADALAKALEWALNVIRPDWADTPSHKSSKAAIAAFRKETP